MLLSWFVVGWIGVGVGVVIAGTSPLLWLVYYDGQTDK